MPSVTIKNTQRVTATFSALDKNGNPLALTNTHWTVLSGDVTVQSSGDGVPSADLVSGDNLGDSVVRAAITADFGEGVQTINQDITVTVVDSNALPAGASISVVFGAPQPK